jgi:hypothetical protein
MFLAEARQQRRDETDADAAAEIAHERGESADFVVLFLRDSRIAKRVDGNEQEGQAECDEDAPTDSLTEADVRIDGGHAPQAEGSDDESHGNEFAWIESGRECAGDGEEKHEHKSAGGDGHSCLSGRVAHDLLQKLRDEHSRRVESDTNHEHDELGHADVAAGKKAQVEDGVRDGEFAPEEECESNDRGDKQSDDEAGAEPVVFLTFIEHDLDGADGDDEEAEAPIVDALTTLADFGEVRRVFDEPVRKIERDDADGDVEKEDPAPGVVVDDPATDGGAKDGSGDHCDSVDRECHAAFLRREGVREDGLLAGLQASTSRALQNTEEDEHAESGREAAEQRCDGEEEDAAHVEPLAADAVGDPAADGQDHGIGDEVAGEDPCGLLGAGAEGAADVGHGDVGDGGVERLHEGGEGDGDGDGPGVGAGSPRVVECGCRRGGHASSFRG